MKNKKIGLIAFAIIFLTYFGFAKEDGGKTVTQGEFAKELVEKMDLSVPKGAPAAEYFKALEARGIGPADGWKQDSPVTAQDLKEVLVEAGRLQAEVISGKEAGLVLKERGIVVPEEINRKRIDDLFKGQDVSGLLNAPATSISGPTIPTPLGEINTIDATPEYVAPRVEIPPEKEEPASELPPTEPPPPPTEPPPRPSGGGGQ